MPLQSTEDDPRQALVGDALYGYRARLPMALEQAGGDAVVVCLFVWLPRFFEHPLPPP